MAAGAGSGWVGAAAAAADAEAVAMEAAARATVAAAMAADADWVALATVVCMEVAATAEAVEAAKALKADQVRAFSPPLEMHPAWLRRPTAKGRARRATAQWQSRRVVFAAHSTLAASSFAPFWFSLVPSFCELAFQQPVAVVHPPRQQAQFWLCCASALPSWRAWPLALWR